MKLLRFLIILLIIASLPMAVSATELLIPGGELIGLELQDNTVTIAAFDESLAAEAKAAGLKEGDRILRIDKTEITCAEDIQDALTHSDGQVELWVMRGTKTKKFTLCPTATENGPKLGIYLRQGTTGIGTVTYYNPDSGDFAALGHGVNAADGHLLQLTEGTTYDAQVTSVKKGTAGRPGQLMGTVTDPQPAGSIEKNTERGIFGNVAQSATTEPMPVASRDSVRTGAATIRSTIDGNCVQEYSVEIMKIYPNAKSKSRNMLLKVTDPQLLEATGGIVQGMSGSPIIQDGKLIGAVTHVLVNDPTMGYGIFIENMLDAAA